MNKITRFLVLVGIIGIFSFSCEKEKIEIDPLKAILGKWEIIEMGNWPDMYPIVDPLAYEEYLPDSILREYEYSTKKSYYKKYWIDATLLNISITREDGLQLITSYKYQFSDKNNRLRLDIQAHAIFNTAIYKRIN